MWRTSAMGASLPYDREGGQFDPDVLKCPKGHVSMDPSEGYKPSVPAIDTACIASLGEFRRVKGLILC